MDIRARAHLLRAAQQDAHRPLADLLEEDVLLGIRVRVSDGGDVLAGNAVLHQLGDDVGIHGVAPGGRVDPQVGEEELGAAYGRGALPDGSDIIDQGVDLRVGEVLRRGREQPRIERQLAAVRGDGQGVILPGLHLPGADRLIAHHEGVLDRILLLRHRAGDDHGLVASEARTGQVQHGGGLTSA